MNTDALGRLWNLTQVHPGTSGARAAAGVLLGLYNGHRFKFDLTDLRLLDQENLDAALAVIRDDAAPSTAEVHVWLNRMTGLADFGERLEHLAHEYRVPGRCHKQDLEPIEPARLILY